MKRIYLISALLLTSLSASLQGQVLNTEFQQFYDEFEELRRINPKPASTYNGTPYLKDEFIPGSIILSNGTIYNSIPLRYNIYYDLFEFMRDSEPLAMDKSEQFYSFKIGDQVFKFESYKLNGKNVSGYLEEIVEGKYSLYLKHIIILRDAKPSGAYQAAEKATFFKQKPEIMIGDGQENIVNIKNAKELLNFFSSMEEAINKFSGNKKLKLKSQQDYIELINYLNSI